MKEKACFLFAQREAGLTFSAYLYVDYQLYNVDGTNILEISQ